MSYQIVCTVPVDWDLYANGIYIEIYMWMRFILRFICEW